MEFRILGPLEVLEDGRPLALGRMKERLVLAVLLLHANEFVPRERLIDELWGESPWPTASPRRPPGCCRTRSRSGAARRWPDLLSSRSDGTRWRSSTSCE